jgi:type I restriction enzyme S subunit
MASSAYQAELEAICPEGWKVVLLTDAAIFQEGPGILAKDFQSSGVPLIRLKGVEGDFVSLEGCNFLAPEKVASKWNHFRLECGDLVISTSASFGRVSEVTEESAGAVPYTGLIRFQPKTKEIDAGFLRAFLGSPAFMQQVEAMASGSVIRHFGPMHLKQMALPLPPLGEQRAIGNMAKLFAERLRNLSKSNETLEAISRALFRAWFVDFEPVRAKLEGRWQRGQSLPGLPGHLYDVFPERLVDSEFREIPETWEVTSVADEFDVTMGQSPPGNTYNETGEGLPFYQGRSDFQFRFPKRRVYCTAPTRLARSGDTLVSVRAPVGDINMASEDCAIGRGVAAVRHKNGYRSYTYQFMDSISDVFQRFDAEGTVFGSIGKKDFHSIVHVKPPHDLVFAFEKLVAPLDDKIDRNERESNYVTQMRETLLPKLISGELRVSDAEAFVREHC